jgi:16S rRNA (cytosine1402-N4)-methyltransferase
LAHIAVLLEESVEALQVRRGGWYVDCTVGGGGHALAILERCAPEGRLLGIDADPQAIKVAAERLKHYEGSFILTLGNFRYLEDICHRFGFYPVDGILFDLGVSSLQLEDRSRGFSFKQDSPLDMRFDPSQELTADDVVNTYPEEELAAILKRYGEERWSRHIARRIVESRRLSSTQELARVVAQAAKARHRIHPATRTFQALRIAVNMELENLELALQQAFTLLRSCGRLVVISFHSLEDRVVKWFFRSEAALKLVTKGVIKPSLAEVQRNPRGRSAKMRVAERITS